MSYFGSMCSSPALTRWEKTFPILPAPMKDSMQFWPMKDRALPRTEAFWNELIPMLPDYRERREWGQAQAGIVVRTKSLHHPFVISPHPGIEFIDKMIEDMLHDLDHEFVVDTDGTIRKRITEQMKDWERRFQLELAPDACESWILQTMRTVKQAITAVTKYFINCLSARTH